MAGVFIDTMSATLIRPPAGSSREIQVHDGSGQFAAATDVVINTSGSIGIGTSAPGSKLHLRSESTVGLRVETTGATLAARLELKNPTASWFVDSDASPDEFRILRDSSQLLTIKSTGNVGIGTASPAGILDLTSTTSAMILTRMTTEQRDAISTPVAGMILYNTSTNVVDFYNGSSWGAV